MEQKGGEEKFARQVHPDWSSELRGWLCTHHPGCVRKGARIPSLDHEPHRGWYELFLVCVASSASHLKVNAAVVEAARGEALEQLRVGRSSQTTTPTTILLARCHILYYHSFPLSFFLIFPIYF